MSLLVGHSYRLVFTGVGSTLTGRLYDYLDLTAPIVTIVADDAAYGSGVSGIVTFSRNDGDYPNLTDMTVDNYYSGPTDPDADIAPAVRNPLAGTPQVSSRTPAGRWTNFWPPASGISFTAKTFTAGQINASATKLYLNDVDYSVALAPLPANGSTVSFTTAAGTLAANAVYGGRIELVDTTGTLKATNTFWFDTFSDAYLASSPVKTVECEDYNYSNGVHQLDPIPVSGMDTNGNTYGGNNIGYYDGTFLALSAAVGTEGIDYHASRGSVDGGFNDYRGYDHVDTGQGVRQEIEDAAHPDVNINNTSWAANYDRPNDNPRQKYVEPGPLLIPEYEVVRTSSGDWLNYTRVFADSNYYVFLRCGSFWTQPAELDVVTSDPTQPAQTTNVLGTFSIQNHLRRADYLYEPLMSGAAPAIVHLTGANTIKLTLDGTPGTYDRVVSLNYLLFVPTSGAAPVLSVANAAGAIKVSWPLIPYTLLSSPSLTSPVWTPVLSGITQVGGQNVYTVASPAASQFFKLVYQ